MSDKLDHTFDLVIIGAGINGAGIARDAAMRGLKVLILDKGDVGSGTSSWSTRLIHGGLRYLEHFEVGLVRESLRERETLLRIAPHLVKPIQILIPVYQNNHHGRRLIRAGMLAYDLLSFDKSLPRHRMLSRSETRKRLPALNPDGLTGGAVYYDCQVQYAERLVLENILSARDFGAQLLTYARVTKIENGSVEFVQCGEKLIAKTLSIVNAAGPWVDQLFEISTGTSNKLIGGTKGSHIVVSPFTGAPLTAIYSEAESDRRPFFVIPWNGNYLVGTTDVRFDDDPDQVRGEPWEIDYLLKETNRLFPKATLSRRDVCYVYSGVRPLAFVSNVQEERITRKHFIREHKGIENLFSIVGGKLTTYRSLAEECVNLIFRKRGEDPPPCRTSEQLLPGAVELSSVETDVHAFEIPTAVKKRLLSIYGSRCNDVLDLCKDQSQLAVPFNHQCDALPAEVVHSFVNESATNLADCLLRRTMLGLNCDLAVGADKRAAEIGKQFLGWSERRALDEVDEYRRFIARMNVGDC